MVLLTAISIKVTSFLKSTLFTVIETKARQVSGTMSQEEQKICGKQVIYDRNKDNS
jgi:hypothetical protein